MGMSTHVYGVRDLDGRFAEMLALKEQCEKLKVSYPEELVTYFGKGYVKESSAFIQNAMKRVELDEKTIIQYSRNGTDGWQIQVKDIPADVVAIRFENSY